MTAPVTVDRARERAWRLFEREARGWAASGDAGVGFDLPLHPPTERSALADLDGTREWVTSWRSFAASVDVEVVWTQRSWPRVGTQSVPERLVATGPAAIAAVAGASDRWEALTSRLGEVRTIIGDSSEADAALRTHARSLTALEDADFARLIDVLGWLSSNPSSGRHVRELPIRGIHTKWIEQRRGLVEAMHRAATGASDLGLREPSPLVRLRVLDLALGFGGLHDVSAPVDDLANVQIRPDRVFVFENLASVLAMPPVRGGVVVHGGGHRVDLIARLPWAQEVTYWGDLDSHGFAILHRLRARGVRAESVMMDAETAFAHRDLWVDDPTPNIGVFPLLTAGESAALNLLSAHGNARLEQERIPWEYAIERIGIGDSSASSGQVP